MTVVDQALCQAEVARLLHRSPRTIRAWTRSGYLPVWFYDDNGVPVYSAATIAAHQRRAGEIAAERVA
jgi:DNA-binding transcriptional MerR regulator